MANHTSVYQKIAVSIRVAVTGLLASAMGVSAFAQSEDPEAVVDWQKHVTDNQRLEALGDDLMGDKIDFNNGSVVFEHTDVDLPGNNGLSVSIKRRLTRGILYDQSQASEFGDWEIIVPRITAVVSEETNFRTGNRCSDPLQFQYMYFDTKPRAGTTRIGNNTTVPTLPHQYSQGMELDTPEHGSDKVLLTNMTSAIGPFPASTKYVTRNNFKISCISNITGGGEGFLAVSPEGHTYRFDRYYERHTQNQILSNYEDHDAKRYRSIIAASEVTDVNGNWVRYTYDAYNRLTRIHSNDGRSISIAYSGVNKPISSVTANGRTWNYNYTTKAQEYSYVEWGSTQKLTGQSFFSLTRATLPDGRYWNFELNEFDKNSHVDGCTEYSTLVPDVLIKHPSGALGRFDFESIRRRVGYQLLETKQVYASSYHTSPVSSHHGIACPSISALDASIPVEGGAGGQLPHIPAPPDEDNPDGIIYSNYTPTEPANLLMYRNMLALTGKSIWSSSEPSFGPIDTDDMEAMTWSLNYQVISDAIFPTPDDIPFTPVDERNNWTKVVEPNGSETTHYYHWDAEEFGGELKRREVRDGPTTQLGTQTVDTTGTTLLRSTDFSYLVPDFSIGINIFHNHIYPPVKQRKAVYTVKEVTKQSGDTFTNETAYNTDVTSLDFSFGQPTQTKAYSNVSSTARVTDTTYANNLGKWILGLVDTITINNRPTIDNTYDAYGRKTQEKRFGFNYATFAYRADGTMAWFKDADDHLTRLYSWKRGVAQRVLRADGVNVYQYVDNNGWLTSVKDGLGRTTAYTRDNMGRVTLINPPGDWANTSISYDFSEPGAVQTITKANKQTIVTYDPMYRPILEETKDILTGISTFVNTKFDGAGQVVFTSQPSFNATETKGVDSLYDGLGRITSSKENVAPFAETKTRYLGSHRKRVTDPSGAWKDYYSYGYEGPDNDDYRAIYEYADGAYQRQTYIYKNVHGELTRVRQWGNQGGVSVNQNRYYYYNSRRKICRYREAEGGDSVFEYTNAGWLKAYQKGLSNGSACTAPTGVAKVSITRDPLGQILETDFADANTADIIKSYDAVGNVLSVDRGTTSWTYDYEPDADLLKSESLAVDGRMYGLTYTYNNAGHMTSKTLPSGRLINYNPDGLGRAREAVSGAYKYAYDMTYHASGQVATYKSRSGYHYGLTLNDRQLPERSTAIRGSSAAVDFTYGYEDRGLVTSVIDGAISGNNRTYGYDGLGQLDYASGPWGNGAFRYDSLGNIRERNLGSRKISLSYDTRNRVNKSTDTGGSAVNGGNTGTRTVAYDNRGNVTTLGNMAFVYDYADQPVTVSGGTNGAYVYDGNKKRVKSTVGGKTIYNVYDHSGALVHIDDRATNERMDYISAEGMTVARIGKKTTYIFSDHLGSPVAGVEWDSVQGWHIEWRERYTPFGITLDNSTANDDKAGFTGHIKDSATGLNYMKARYYDPVIGRFLSRDPVVFNGKNNTGFFNRYTYTFNNPINLIDPLGMAPGDSFGSIKEVAEDWRKYVQDENAVDNKGNEIKIDKYEYSSLIYKDGVDGDGNATYSYNAPRTSRSSKTVPWGGTKSQRRNAVAGIHNHPRGKGVPSSIEAGAGTRIKSSNGYGDGNDLNSHIVLSNLSDITTAETFVTVVMSKRSDGRKLGFFKLRSNGDEFWNCSKSCGGD